MVLMISGTLVCFQVSSISWLIFRIGVSFYNGLIDVMFRPLVRSLGKVWRNEVHLSWLTLFNFYQFIPLNLIFFKNVTEFVYGIDVNLDLNEAKYLHSMGKVWSFAS